ncbi:translocation/assembly module TamB domain-containing protein [Cellulophaga sp. HaHaR_3_176]|uniref:translocation/assembly module TamB domain-containing protein n=1 Tax=Cellulophaga sp. HaHaR_3_176 TaxID=1942464 RepID=UPI001C1F7E17|nr:translocation/assembly module TamB [Cellulophaga sp. HaHaR_3_176]QWX84969.1 translocation/assembly module TamB domain-containing protein [Cellulophaga sp. HaHaR_3_176]
MKTKKILKRILKVFAVILLLFIGIILFIRSQWGQDIIVSKAVNYVSNKTNTEIRLERLFLTFSGNIFLEGLYLEDTKGDTLIYAKQIEANLPFKPLIFGDGVSLNSLEWDGLKANISRKETSEKFNFNFLLDAFASKDTVQTTQESEPLAVSIGSISLANFDVNYNDQHLGIESSFQMKKLQLDVDEIDLENMHFEVDDLTLQNTNIKYKQTKAFPVTNDSTESKLPFISIDNLNIKEVFATYNSIPDGIVSNINIGDFNLKLPKANLISNQFNINTISLNNSTIYLNKKSKDLIDENVTETGTPFTWPNYLIKVDEIDFNNNNITYISGEQKPTIGTFNSSALTFSNLILKANEIEYDNGKTGLSLQEFSFNEKSGFELQKLAFDAEINDKAIAISNLNLQTNRSSIIGYLSLQYPSIQKLIETPESATLNFSFPKINLNVKDAYVFQPDLVNNEYVNKIALKPFTGNLISKGTLKALDITDAKLNWGDNTQFLAQGELFNITEPDSLSFNLNTVKAHTSRKDVLNFISENDLGISIPKSIAINATARGKVDNIDGNIEVILPEGTAKLTGNFNNEKQIKFTGNLKVDSLKLGKLLNNNQLGDLSFTMNASGGGNNINSLNATLDTDFTQLGFNTYDFSNLKLNGEIVNGKGDINIGFKDENLNLQANTQLDLDSIASNIKLNLNLIGADLFALGITQQNIKLGSKVNASFSGNSSNFKLKTSITETIAVYNNEQYRMATLGLNAKIDSESTNVTIDSDILNGILTSNGSPDTVISAIEKQFKGYFSDQNLDTITDPIIVDMDFTLNPSPILTDVFFTGVERLDVISMKANFNATSKNLTAKLLMPSAMYNGSAVDSLSVLVNGNATDLNFTASLARLSADPILIKKTLLEGNLKNNALLLDFISFDEDKKLVHLASEITLTKDTIQVHVNPSELIFNKKQWTIPQDNLITISDKFLNFKNIKFSKDTQELTISNAIENIDKEHLGVEFNNFKLQTILSLLNPDEALASGLVNGRLVVENPFGATGIIADFNINKLEALQKPLGNLNLKAASTGRSKYDFNLTLKDGTIDLDLTGDYAAAETGAKLNLDLDLNRLDLKMLENFSEGAIINSEGNISGNIKVNGTTDSPIYNGKISFNDTKFEVADLNSSFKISKETLKIDNSGLYLDSFKINDVNDNSFTVAGNILTEQITNPAFNLSLTSNAFQVMNSTKEDNELFYGKASIDTDITVKGDLSLPIVKGLFRIRKITDITYIVPESQLDVEERDGVVIFVNQENPDAILTRNDAEESSSLFKGFKVNTILEIADDAVFNIVIDKKTGDNLRVSGDAALNFGMSSNGNMSLTGRYELKDGHYETSLYNLVKRKFDIKPGSTITWQGSPTDASLDVSAIYNVETSASPLMASVTSSEDASVTNKYRQVLPFLVYLNVDGQLLEPKISFDLDMPEDAQGSLSGAVYAQVQQLNDQESELNKQVFSLLALNRFFPNSGSDGSGGGTATLARDNVNKVLSGELNSFSDKLLGNTGFELDFDLDSYTDYQGDNPQDRTQLNINAKKKLFNNRLIVSAGSAVDVEGSSQTDQGETPIIGNVSLEYLLSEDGRYRLKGFRKNEYQNVIDGQLILTGVALIFNREFNNFSELFNPIKNEEKSSTDKKNTAKENK